MGSARTITVDAASKLVTMSPAVIALHERVSLVIQNVSLISADDLRLAIASRTVTLAECTAFTASGLEYIGTLDLGDSRLVAAFSGASPQEQRRFDLVLADMNQLKLLVNASISIQNNPYTPGMALPTVGV